LFTVPPCEDDPRNREEIAKIRDQFDPLIIHSARLSETELAQAETEVAEQIDQAFTRAFADPFPQLLENVQPNEA
jgi:TPP-dependent pyruvate/acetoin dehydrogenase alpha subunit